MKHSTIRPEHYVPRTIYTGTKDVHHCYRRDCEWYYDGSTMGRAMLPRYTTSLLEQIGVLPDPPGRPHHWINEWSKELDYQIKLQRSFREGV